MTEGRTVDMASTPAPKENPEVISVGRIQVPKVLTNTNGTLLHTLTGADQKPDLKKLQELVGGYIEIVTIKADELVPVGSQLIVNENGLMTGLPLNSAASQIYRSTCRPEYQDQAVIVGDAVLLVNGAQVD